MGLSISTVMTIKGAGKSILCTAGELNEEGKCAGFIYYCKAGEIHSLLVSTGPVFDSKDAAILYMKGVVEYCDNYDLSGSKSSTG